MRGALLALLVSAAALASRESSTASAAAVADEREAEQEDESDSAPFMIVVEHSDGHHCGGSLVSLRTALTSAWCARATRGAPPAELWALAPGSGAVRRVARVALAAGAEDARDGDAWSGAAMDLAVLELVAPFGGGARSRPILMATQPSECAPRAVCHVVRALPRAGSRTPRLRIVDATLVPGDACAQRASGWPGLRDSALCLVGPTLCQSDWGAGVVCEGKLCGVLSRSVTADAAAVDAADVEPGVTCGDTHVAQSVARWRRFLHCAHTLRACGRGGECAALCSERRLLDVADGEPRAAGDAPAGGGDAAPATGDAPPAAGDALPAAGDALPVAGDASSPAALDAAPYTAPDAETPPFQHTTSLPAISTSPRPGNAASATPPTRSLPPSPSTEPALPVSSQPSARPAFEFEPNRPDFKAGEYGENGADYGGDDGPPPPSTAATSPSTAAPRSTPAARQGAVQARVSPPAARPHRSAASPSRAAHWLIALLAITNLAK
ncbi:uncharacterized protein LOC126912894 isoform X2 [Spodoptera frugiperda]|uniref:Uncharacterized protein LOC126912894 isoform X2 n=1 Tax=Spodoptera frugiperda TaxID=7108 RepID=A0A9R0F569_SPOFR|nr:uncharacterized protein LOC126912894 isoform X2 [Spodoptera frugiperda]